MTLQSDLLALLPEMQRFTDATSEHGSIDAAVVREWIARIKYGHAELAAMARDAERYRWLRDNVQPWINGNERPHAIVNVCVGELADGKIGWHTIIGRESRVGVATLDMAVDAAMAAAIPTE